MPTIQERILEQVARANGPICDDCLVSRALLKQRQDANREGRKLEAKEQLTRTKDRCVYCGTNKIVNVAISNLTPTIERTEPPTPGRSELLPFDCRTTFRWETVLETDGTAYRYPCLPSKGMKQEYSGPAVYRWVPYHSTGEDLGKMYIGEAQSLIKRIGNYRKGGPGQRTSFRLRQLFEGFLANGVALRLERLCFDELAVGSTVFSETDLSDRLVRRFLEHMMASYYRKLGWNLINAS